MSAPAAESVKRANEDPENDRADEAQAKRQATALSMLSSAALDEDASEELAANEGARNIFEEQLRQLQALQQEHAEGGKVHVSDSDDDDEEKEGKSNKVKNKWLFPPKQQRGPRVGDEYQANLP